MWFLLPMISRYDKEQVGKLHLGLSEKAVKQLIPGQPTRGPEKLWGADGEYHQEWQYPAAGITLSMSGRKKGGPKSHWRRITLTSPSTLSNLEGVSGLAAPRRKSMKIMDASGMPRIAKAFYCFIAGSIFGGVMFNFYARQGEPDIYWRSRRMSLVGRSLGECLSRFHWLKAPLRI